jgi:hypothetical protein
VRINILISPETKAGQEGALNNMRISGPMEGVINAIRLACQAAFQPTPTIPGTSYNVLNIRMTECKYVLDEAKAKTVRGNEWAWVVMFVLVVLYKRGVKREMYSSDI